MLSKFQTFKLFSHLGFYRPCKTHRFNSWDKLLCNHFSNIIEAPEIPNWVKFSQNGEPNVDPDDDFVIPELADWVQGHKLYDHSREVRSLVTEITYSDVDKLSEVLKGRFDSPDDVVKAIVSEYSVNVSEGLVEQVLKRFSNDWIPSFGVFNWAKQETGFRHSVESYNSMVDILGKCNKFDIMWELVEEMDRVGGYVSLVTMSKIMRRLARARKWDDAVEVFRGIERFGVKKDVEAMNVLLDTLVKEHSVEQAQDVFSEFKDTIQPNSYTFNILVHGWCKIRQMENARKTMEEMETCGIQPDVVSYTSLIEAYCREKDFRKVDAIFDEMQEKDCPPNVVTYTILMHHLGKAKEINQALEVYERMKRNDCVPDTSFYSSLIFILSKAGRLKDALEIFEDMPKQGVSRDPSAYNTMISSFCAHSQEENALKLLQQMEEASCKPDLKTYSPLLKMCCKKKRMKVLFFLLSHMFKNDVSIDLATYSLLVHGLCKSGKLEHACLFFEEMLLKGLVSKDTTYKTLMKELEEKSMEKAKEQIEKLMSRVQCN